MLSSRRNTQHLTILEASMDKRKENNNHHSHIFNTEGTKQMAMITRFMKSDFHNFNLSLYLFIIVYI
jgi:hypothetical protein